MTGGASTACSSDNDVAAFVDACTTETNMGEAICTCVANKAVEELSSDGFAFLLAGMSGDEARAEQLRESLDVSEAMQAGMFMVNAPASCVQ